MSRSVLLGSHHVAALPPALLRSIVYTEFFQQVAELNAAVRAPDQFQLVQNFRTHSGIVKLAHSVVAAMTRFFPDSVDKLQPETSQINGEGASHKLLRNWEGFLHPRLRVYHLYLFL